MDARTLREIATDIVKRLHAAGFSAYWVGGCVRDFLLGREPGDYDIVTGALPDQIEAIFERTIPVGRKFGVVVVLEGGRQFQVATFRAEADYRDGRRPELVSFGNATADALRRDFTVNGLFFDPVHNQILDWVKGEADLKAKLIRTIGAPEERFGEDHLRMLRAVRLAAQLDFEIEAGTFRALQVNAAKIRGISAERIREELVKLFSPPHAGRGLELLRESGLLAEVLPGNADRGMAPYDGDFIWKDTGETRRIKNTGTTPITNYKAVFELYQGQAIQAAGQAGATFAESGPLNTVKTATPVGGLALINPGATADLSFVASWDNLVNQRPPTVTLTGSTTRRCGITPF